MYSFGQKILDIVVTEYSFTPGNINSWLTYPPKPELGDFALGCFGIAKELGRNPVDIAKELSVALSKEETTFKNVSNMGPYVNFRLNDNYFVTSLVDFQVKEKDKKNETVIVDYIGANVGKPLHIGHLCTPSIGQALINIHEYSGYEVISDSHFGDWGGIFGKLIYMWKFGESEGLNTELLTDKDQLTYQEFQDNRLLKDGVSYLLYLYFAFHVNSESYETEFENRKKNNENRLKKEEGARKEFQYLSGVGIDLSNEEERNHHEENVELWKKFTAISISEVSKQLEEELNIKPKYNIGESFYEGLDLPRPNDEDYPDLQYTMKDIVKELLDKGIAQKNEDGSVGVIFPEETKLSSCVLQKKDGTGLYLTSDLAAIKYRLTNGWNPSKIIYSVDVRQQLHLKQAFWIAKKAWPELEKVELVHAYNGFIKLKEGAMSTRKGTVIFLKDLIEEGYKKTENILTEKGRQLSQDDIRKITVSAIKYSYLSQDREKDVVFDWDKALSFEGNSGPYIQYAYVRARKIIGNFGSNGSNNPPTPLIKGVAEEGGYIDLNFQNINNSFNENKLKNIITQNITNLSVYDKNLIKKLLEFDSKIEETLNKYKPHILAQYSYDLASEFNSFYVHTPKILEEKNEDLKNFRLLMIQKFSETLVKSFELLGMEMPSEM